jgi:hypothetical protein
MAAPVSLAITRMADPALATWLHEYGANHQWVKEAVVEVFRQPPPG